MIESYLLSYSWERLAFMKRSRVSCGLFADRQFSRRNRKKSHTLGGLNRQFSCTEKNAFLPHETNSVRKSPSQATIQSAILRQEKRNPPVQRRPPKQFSGSRGFTPAFLPARLRRQIAAIWCEKRPEQANGWTVCRSQGIGVLAFHLWRNILNRLSAPQARQIHALMPEMMDLPQA